MIISKALIGIVFRIINFFLIVFVAYYIFKKYLAAGIKQQMSEKEEHVLHLQQQELMLKNQETIEQEKLIAQKEQYHLIQKQVQLWTAIVEKKQREQETQQEEIKRKIQQTMLHHAEIIADYQLQKHAWEKTIDTITHALHNYYDNKEGKMLVGRIISQCKRAS